DAGQVVGYSGSHSGYYYIHAYLLTPINAPPDAVNDSATTAAGAAVTVAVLANDSDPDGDALSVTAVTQGAHGAVVVNADDTVTYTPAAGFSGTDQFTYTISDGNGGSATAAVTITVNPGPSNAAAFVGEDASTQGSWQGVYGG